MIPLVAHIIYRLDVGGLENGLVNLVNGLPADRFRHVIVCLTDYTSFRQRITAPNVELIALNKPAGNSPGTHVRMLRLLRRLRPAIVHTRNLAAQEHQIAAFLAKVPVRIHSEHGRDADDRDGTNWKYLTIRRFLRPLVHHYVALSLDLRQYLTTRVKVPSARITHICNGVDTEKFHPAPSGRRLIGPPGFADDDSVVIGTVGRMDPVKDPLNLVRAFVYAAAAAPDLAPRLRLVMVGDGVLRTAASTLLESSRLSSQAWLPGSMSDVSQVLQGLDVFVLPSLSEGISNTILEAMASGLPVIATRVGGNPELMLDGITGRLVPHADHEALSGAIVDYARDPVVRQQQGRRARDHALEQFSIHRMIDAYACLYAAQLATRGVTPAGSDWRTTSATHSR